MSSDELRQIEEFREELKSLFDRAREFVRSTGEEELPDWIVHVGFAIDILPREDS